MSGFFRTFGAARGCRAAANPWSTCVFGLHEPVSARTGASSAGRPGSRPFSTRSRRPAARPLHQKCGRTNPQVALTIVRDRKAGELERWLADAAESELRSFADGLRQDEAAVRAALRLPWSNGQTEGQITRLKLIKRQTFGRAKHDLLRARVLQAA